MKCHFTSTKMPITTTKRRKKGKRETSAAKELQITTSLIAGVNVKLYSCFGEQLDSSLKS